MPSLGVRYFVRVVNKIDPDPNLVRPPADAPIEQLVAWDRARADFKEALKAVERPPENATMEQLLAWDKTRAEFKDVHEPKAALAQEGFYLCRDGQLTDRVCRGLDFWDADDLGLVDKMIAQLEAPKFGKWVTEVTPFHEDNEVE